MIYDADYQLSHQIEKCNEFPNTLVYPYDYFWLFYDILPVSWKYKYCLFSIAKLNKFN
jgi:hypothetical protein